MLEEETHYGDAPVYLTVLTPEQFSLLLNPTISSVHGFPIHQDFVLFTKNQRGLDIIGGHVEQGETPDEAMIREAKEEACLNIRKMRVIGAIKVDNRDNPKAVEKGYAPIGYQLFYAIDNFELEDFVAKYECTGREYVFMPYIKDKHHKWLRSHQALLAMI